MATLERLVPLPPQPYSLSLDGHLQLGGIAFKYGMSFLHADGGWEVGNTALGLSALFSVQPGYPYSFSGSRNTAIGTGALFGNTSGFSNTAMGRFALGGNESGGQNTAIGMNALWANRTGHSNTVVGALAMGAHKTGSSNTAVGIGSLWENTDGSSNTALGSAAMLLNTTGSNNVALGYVAGYFNETGSNNIWISSQGDEESNTLRIGEGTGTGPLELNRAFISGIRGVTPSDGRAVAVVIDEAGQLGTIRSSRRWKEDIRAIGVESRGLRQLRPVTFRYSDSPSHGPKPLHYGLIAEEVAEVYPEMVAYDDQGRPEAVLYRFLAPMLLNELQKEQRENEAQRREIGELRARLERLEATLEAGG